jgi:hypothetical protein
MEKLEARKKQREYFAKVNSGEIKDNKVTHGTDDAGNVLGDNGKPVSGTAPKGFDPNADDRDLNHNDADDGTGGGGGENDNNDPGVDYSKLRTHEELNGEKGLAGRNPPDKWNDMTVADKQKWLSDEQEKSRAGNGGGWGQ